MKIKHFMDIASIRETATEFTEPNTYSFQKGDHIVIQVKFDGTNASIRYDTETKSLAAFSRKLPVSFDNTLNGFYSFVQTLNPEDFAVYPNFTFFGEWAVKNKVIYKPEYRKKWFVYDIYDHTTEQYLPWNLVKSIVEKLGLTHIHVLYDGPFLSWEHCKSFMREQVYTENTEEGIVVKNITRLNNPIRHCPSVLKIVDSKFKERISVKEIDPEKLAAKDKATQIAMQIVTKNRIEKELFKMRDENIIPAVVTPEMMGLIAKTLPKRIYADCVKEEPEMVVSAGEPFGKICGSRCMKIAREIILGGQ